MVELVVDQRFRIQSQGSTYRMNYGKNLQVQRKQIILYCITTFNYSSGQDYPFYILKTDLFGFH